MKRNIKTISILLLCSFWFISCATHYNRDIPETYSYTSASGEKYSILGNVSMTTSNGLLFGLIRTNSRFNNFNDFVKYAKEMYPEADAIINCYVDETTEVYGGIYISNTYHYHATAIKYIQ